MVRRIEGLKAVDTEILRFLAGHKFAHFESGPTLIADHIGSTAATVSRHLDRLEAAELVVESTTHKQGGRHAVTELGRRYLADDLDDQEASDIEERVAEYIENL